MSKIDVSKCAYYFCKGKCAVKGYGISQDITHNRECNANNNCYYKQLQKVKEENELLKNERTIDLRNQLEQLKADNDELRNQVKFKNQFRDYAHKYKNALDEIEEIILKRQKEHYCYCDECSPFKEILQLIKQVKDGE